jgi:hypothetical protein
LEEHIYTLQVHFTGKCGELVFDLAELGSADWEDRRIKKVIAPAALRQSDVYYSVCRRPRYITLLARVSAASDAIAPVLITTRPIHASLWSRGGHQNKDVMVRRRSPPYLDEELFFEYTMNVFIA